MEFGTLNAGGKFGENGRTKYPDPAQCCFYIFQMITKVNPHLHWIYVEFSIKCDCRSCDTDSVSTHHQEQMPNGVIRDNWYVVRECDCKCRECCEAWTIGYGRLRGQTMEDLLRMIGSRDWSKLSEWVDNPPQGLNIIRFGDSDCPLPVPNGWNETADMPPNIHDLDCCTR